jgi:hypothetical protein
LASSATLASFRSITRSSSSFLAAKVAASPSPEMKLAVTDLEKIMSWFPGPFNMDLLERVTSLLHHKWFYGNISKEEATSLVAGVSADCFLVRFSSQPGSFALTLKLKNINNGQPIHYRIEPKPDGTWVLGENRIFPCLEAIVYDNDMLKEARPLSRE